MLIVMQTGASETQIRSVCERIVALGLKAHPIPGKSRTAIGITGNSGQEHADEFASLPGVIEIIRVTKPYKLTSLEVKPERTVVRVGNVCIGGDEPVVIAGPCSVESREQMVEIAEVLRRQGAHLIRGGAFKPRSSPYSFQGLGHEALDILAEVRDQTGLPVVTEALNNAVFDAIEEVVDVIQIGARNMQNFDLLRRAGRSSKPILLKRSMSATLEEFLLAAEYIITEGNQQVILCERGIRTFGDHCRYTLDLGIVPVLKSMTHLPIIVDPSHAAGRRDIVLPLTRAALAVGSDGVIVEVHPDPERALSDGAQSLTIAMFERLMAELRMIVPALSHVEAT